MREREDTTAVIAPANGDAPPLPAMLRWLFRPVPIAPLVYFRIVFGLVIVWEVCRYFAYGWVRELFLAAHVQFKYFGFEWVRTWPGMWLYVHFVALAVLGGMIALGAFYRLATVLFFLAFTYVFLLDQANYLNHLYLVCLLGFLAIFLPAHRAFSIDAAGRPDVPALTHVPAWTLYLLLFQIGVPYFFGGVAKLNHDWLHGEPMRTWMRGDHFPIIGGWAGTEPGVWVFCYGGLLFDLLIVPALIWPRTRLVALLAAGAFHLSNAITYDIGIFPWLMLATLPLFFSLRWWERINERWIVPRATAIETPAPQARSANPRLVATLLLAYAAIQILVPLRHWLYPGSVHWTEEGHRFSWHMMLRSKRGSATFVVSHPSLPEPVTVNPRRWLTPRQRLKMPGHPDMVLQFAHFLAESFGREGYPNAEVRADVRVSLNGRKPQALIDPAVNLAAVERRVRHAPWIVPLEEPLMTRPLPWRPPARVVAPEATGDDVEDVE